MHRRRLELDGDRATLKVEDTLQMTAEHALAICFHFAEHCTVSADGPSILAISNRASLRISPDPRLSASLQRGSTNPIAGWTSRTYHRKSAATTLVLSGRFDRDVTLLTSVAIST
jgi:hypothetical protein